MKAWAAQCPWGSGCGWWTVQRCSGVGTLSRDHCCLQLTVCLNPVQGRRVTVIRANVEEPVAWQRDRLRKILVLIKDMAGGSNFYQLHVGIWRTNRHKIERSKLRRDLLPSKARKIIVVKSVRTSENKKVESLVSGSDTLDMITGSRFVVLRSHISILRCFTKV